MQAQSPARPIGTIKPTQNDPFAATVGHSHVMKPTGKIDKNASAEKNAAATIETPRPNMAPKIAGSTQRTIVKK
jgi:hypothetical protein